MPEQINFKPKPEVGMKVRILDPYYRGKYGAGEFEILATEVSPSGNYWITIGRGGRFVANQLDWYYLEPAL